MAVLEAFVYDPLINWRLMQVDVDRRTEGNDTPEQRSLSSLISHIDTDRAPELVRVAAHPEAPLRKLKADENDIFNGENA